MARGPDGIDFGLWKFISPARLVIPVDRHIARMAALLGLTARRSPDWKMALDITRALRALDPEDPVRYDFALVRPGITGECPPSSRDGCRGCILGEVCGGAVEPGSHGPAIKA
jgi:endonuclease III